MEEQAKEPTVGDIRSKFVLEQMEKRCADYEDRAATIREAVKIGEETEMGAEWLTATLRDIWAL